MGDSEFLDKIVEVESNCYANIFFSEQYFSEKKRGVLNNVVKVVTSEFLFRNPDHGYDGGLSANFDNGLSSKISTLRNMYFSDEDIADSITSSRDEFRDKKNIQNGYDETCRRKQCLEVYDAVVDGLDELIGL
jgi:hypothetical protein